jgi:transcriptional regulator with XRE-family HTH domain
MARRELARFLRDRREDLRPADVGLPAGPRRRTPGLRREEVAGLAHISVDYYIRLEQARGPHPSARILEAVTAALRLTPGERRHVFQLAGASPAAPPGLSRQVRPYVTGLLHRMPGAAAVVTDASYDVIACNPLAEALLGDLAEQPNLARRRFLTGEPRESAEAAQFALIVASRLRTSADRYPHDERLARLLADLHAGSDAFVQAWNANPVITPGHRVKTVTHPEAGDLRVNCDVLTVPDEDQQVVFITADPGTEAERALHHLRNH